VSERILICGDRNWSDQQMIIETLSQLGRVCIIECVIEGEARGADTMARIAAETLGIYVLKFPANWGKYGRAAGPIRNQQMLDEGKPTLVLAFHNDIEHSRGTKNMVEKALKANIHVEVINEHTRRRNEIRT